MDTTIITTIITAATTLIVSMGTWHISARTARKKEQEEITNIIEGYRDELRNKMESLKDEVTQVNASVQQQIALVQADINVLTKAVDKHNSVIERTYSLEKSVEVQEEKIRVANHRIEDLEKRVS